MATRKQVRDLLASGLDFAEIGRRLGIPPGLAHLVGTGLPADGSDAPSPEERRSRGLPPTAQDLVNPPHENPTSRETVHRWIGERVRADAQMRAAGKES
ncbi:hypothetical protein FHX82_007069 [Amycolatopsis bartoniae]|uniref:Uncharacterized protein n=1 Tax=Amycolatopsis bartoniae TaxID=941986 RepID=A0A8H9ILU0_9PSEU|nr:hypothetical protein [Amycolatopsis bartoniae]MBB2939983.1 hypothetical protein [Amycolatopsis bartoniae]TVT09952.1 hypothetical protein FNH07_06815 [Amycolatopsis bartoniae]GHF32220.1 hypothetical protein GCM10017566_00890 [Amycolatopsis bartoniae]